MNKKGQRKVIGWIPYWDQDNAFKSLISHAGQLDYVSVFWYRIDEKGKIKKYEHAKEDRNIIAFAKKNNIKIMALVANMPEYYEKIDWDYRRVDKVISSWWARKIHIARLIDLVESKNFDGIDIDYEALKKYQRDNFSTFIEELSFELHKRGKLLGVAIHPKTGEYIPQEDNGSHAQDLKRISKAADHLYFMTYLENGTFSQPGPLGSPSWMEEVLNYALKQSEVDREKAFLGIGLTGVEWKKESNGKYTGERADITFDEVYSLVQEYKPVIKWDGASHTPYIEYLNSIFWFENSHSVSERLKLANALNVGGIAFWRLGREDRSIWDQLRLTNL